MGKKNKGNKGKPLTGLAAALVKSGHLSEKKAKKLTREKRREDKALGRDEVERLEAEKQRALVQQRAAEAEAARLRERQRTETEEESRARRLILSNLAKGIGGGRRWFFVARDGRIGFLDVRDDIAGMLARGGAGIVEGLGLTKGEHGVVFGEKALEALHAIDPELVRFWNRGAQG